MIRISGATLICSPCSRFPVRGFLLPVASAATNASWLARHSCQCPDSRKRLPTEADCPNRTLVHLERLKVSHRLGLSEGAKGVSCARNFYVRGHALDQLKKQACVWPTFVELPG